MKKQLSITLLTIVSIASVLLNLSCGGTPQNNTTGNNAASGNAAPGNTAQSNQTFVVTDCSGNSADKQKKIKDGIKNNIKKDGKLDSQYTAKKFDFEPIVEANGDATLYIWGSIFTSGNDLDNLNKTYKDYVKKGCVTRLAFTSAPAITADLLILDFKLCEAPNEICSDGSCQLSPCNRLEGNVNTNMKSNSNK